MATVNSLFKKSFRSNSIVIATVLSAGLLTGCSYLEPYKAPVTQGNVMTTESVGLLQEGLTKQQVRELLGPPTGANPFNPMHWEYIYYTTISNSKTKDHTRHLVLQFDKDNLLDNWKESNHNVALKEDDSWLGLGWF